MYRRGIGIFEDSAGIEDVCFEVPHMLAEICG